MHHISLPPSNLWQYPSSEITEAVPASPTKIGGNALRETRTGYMASISEPRVSHFEEKKIDFSSVNLVSIWKIPITNFKLNKHMENWFHLYYRSRSKNLRPRNTCRVYQSGRERV